MSQGKPATVSPQPTTQSLAADPMPSSGNAVAVRWGISGKAGSGCVKLPQKSSQERNPRPRLRGRHVRQPIEPHPLLLADPRSAVRLVPAPPPQWGLCLCVFSVQTLPSLIKIDSYVFYSFGCCVNGSVFLMSFSDCSLPLYRNMTY